MFMLFRTVLDIDLIKNKYSSEKPKDKQFMDRIIEKIKGCKNNVYVKVKSSSFKGFHIEVFCKIKCDICRMCYDDDKHFAYDLNRPDYARNILFDEKEIIRIDAKRT